MLEEKARNIASVAKAKMGDTGVIPAGVVPEETVAQIEQAEVPTSLLERTEEEPSLLSRGQ